jgi:hypothetical protein
MLLMTRETACGRISGGIDDPDVGRSYTEMRRNDGGLQASIRPSMAHVDKRKTAQLTAVLA